MWVADGIHKTESGHLVPQDAQVPPLSGASGILHVGMRATVAGPVLHRGAIVLAAGARAGDIHGGHEVIVGSRCRTGHVRSEGRIVVQAGSTVGDLHAAGDILLFGQLKAGNVTAGGDIIIVGAPQTGALAPGGRVTTRPY